MPLWVIAVMTFLANIIAIYMFVVVDRRIDSIVQENLSFKDKAEARQLEKEAEKTAKSQKSSINLTKKGGK